MNITKRLSFAGASLMLAFTIGVPSLAFAEGLNAHANAMAAQHAAVATTGQTNETDGTADDSGQPAGSNQHARNSKGSAKLADAKLKVCQKREKHINDHMQRIAARGQKQLDRFSTIADKTEQFYAKKGKTLSNYDELVNDVNTKKTAAQATVDKVKATSVTFKCDGTDPKGAAASFKDALKAEIAALKGYKTSVRKLIVGVKSVQGTTSSSDNTTNNNNSGGAQQ